MTISRRKLLCIATGGGVIALGGGTIGLLAAERAIARNALSKELVSQATPLLVEKSDKELEALPNTAREGIREYFLGVCLNVHGFAAEVCTEAFAERLAACNTDDDKHRLLNVKFGQKVVSGVEVINHVRTIASEVGAELNRNWARCCSSMTASWKTTINRHVSNDVAYDLAASLEPLILQQLDEARRAAYPIGQRPALSQEIEDIGKSAVLLLAISEIAPGIEFPVFVVEALVHLWRWLVDQFSNRAADLQSAVTDRLALLGNRVGDEFQRELRTRISDLQRFQEQSVPELARRKANECIPELW